MDLLIPTCEEVFYLSKGRPNLKRASKCTLFFQDISILRVLHDKWLFAELVRTQSGSLQKGVQIPNTTLIDSEKGKADLNISNISFFFIVFRFLKHFPL